MRDRARHLLQGGDEPLGEVDVGAEDAGAGCHKNVAQQRRSRTVIGGDIWIDLHTRTPRCPTTSPTTSARPSTAYRDMLRDDPRGRRRACRPSRAATRWRVAGALHALPDGPRRRGDHRALDQGLRRARRSASCARSSTAPARSSELRGVRLRLVGRRGRPRRSARARGLEPGDLGPGSYGHAFRNFTTDLDGDGPGLRPARRTSCASCATCRSTAPR